MEVFDVEYYTKENGEQPFQDFLDGLEPKMQAKVLALVTLLTEKGDRLRPPKSEQITNGIYELRAKVGTDITRSFYFFLKGKKAVITHGIIKKTQKTPPQEIRRAERYRKDYLKRHGEEQ